MVAAHHLGLDRPVAIKLMRPELRTRKEFVRRFVREARAAARLNSPHVARVFDVGVLDDGAPYIVMEYLDGSDLASWLRQHGPVSVSLAAAIVLQACDAIAEAHAAGIIHRDLKPSNLLVVTGREDPPLVKVLDLGICKLLSSADEPADTAPGPALGTPRYMAPEQLVGAGRADPRSDLWSLGAILYELVTEQAPLHGRAVAEPGAPEARGPVPAIGRGVPAEFEAIVARCLAPDPGARFQRAADLAAALALFAGASAGVPVQHPGRRVRRSRWWALPATLVAGIAATGVWMQWPARDDHAPATDPGRRDLVSIGRSAAPAAAIAPVPTEIARPPAPPSPTAIACAAVESPPAPVARPSAGRQSRSQRPLPLVPAASPRPPSDQAAGTRRAPRFDPPGDALRDPPEASQDPLATPY